MTRALLTKHKKVRSSSWLFRENILFVLTSAGPEEVRIAGSYTTEEVWFWYAGRHYKFAKIDIRAYRKYYYHAAWLSEEVNIAFSTLASSLMNARFAAFQPEWVREKSPAIFINGEKIFFLKVARGYMVIKYQDVQHFFRFADGLVSYEPDEVEDFDLLPEHLEFALEKIGSMLLQALPPRKIKKPVVHQFSLPL